MKLINLPRSALVWLLVAITSVYIPLQMQLPAWLSLVFIIVVGWRWMIYLGRWSYPGSFAKVFVVVLAIVAVIASAQGRFHLESAASFILVASLLKVLEIKNQRDGYTVIFLGLFLLAVNFLFEQGILTAIYSLVVVWVLLAALVGLHQTHVSGQYVRQNIKRAGKTSGQVLLLSLPIMLILFFLFPRLGPLWSLNLQSGKAKTGLSEYMSPGDIAELSNSDELVFRVEFSGDMPTPDKWYWRGLVLDSYHEVGGVSRWSQSGIFDQIDWYPSRRERQESSAEYDYTIIQEVSDNKWLFGLRGVAAMEVGIGIKDNDLIVSKAELNQRKEYKVRSWPEMNIAKQGLLPVVRQQSLQVSKVGNPKTRQLVQQIVQQSTIDQSTDEQRMEAMLHYFNQQNFSYTLKPNQMRNNDIDKFLFENRAGFCAHYSSSFVFIMRLMGIPARVVAGYQGGDLNPDSGHITVRQYDAHAWVEVWLENQGWVSVDPTAQVAPNRISLGLRQALAEGEEFLAGNNFSLIKLSHLAWLNDFRFQLDQLNYYWHQRVLNFNKNRQGSLLKEWFGNGFLKKSLYALATLFCLFFFSMAIMLLWRKPVAPATLLGRTLVSFDKKIRRHQMQRKESEGLGDYSERLQLHFPLHALSIKRLFDQLQNFYFAKPIGRQFDAKAADEKQLAKNLLKMARKLSTLPAAKTPLADDVGKTD
jgi:transglutaminase-like putative cysteine protease